MERTMQLGYFSTGTGAGRPAGRCASGKPRATPPKTIFVDSGGPAQPYLGTACKALEILDTAMHKIHAASAKAVWVARTCAGVV